jgi:hypothetical protein
LNILLFSTSSKTELQLLVILSVSFYKNKLYISNNNIIVTKNQLSTRVVISQAAFNLLRCKYLLIHIFDRLEQKKKKKKAKNKKQKTKNKKTKKIRPQTTTLLGNFRSWSLLFSCPWLGPPKTKEIARTSTRFDLHSGPKCNITNNGKLIV